MIAETGEVAAAAAVPAVAVEAIEGRTSLRGEELVETGIPFKTRIVGLESLGIGLELIGWVPAFSVG